MNDKLLSFLGLCRRAGKMSFGNDTVLTDMKSGTSQMVLIAADLSKNSEKSIIKTAKEYGVPLYRISRTKDEIERAIAKYTAIISINDSGFAKKLKELKGAQSNEFELEECNL